MPERMSEGPPLAPDGHIDWTRVRIDVPENDNPPYTESLDGIPTEGMNAEQATWFKDNLTRIGLPLTDQVTKLRYAPNTRGNEGVLGTANSANGEFTLYKKLEGLPEIAQYGTMVHEGLHFSDPFLPEHIGQYGEGEEAHKNWEAAQEHTRAIARQTHETKVFLNGYHKYLYKQWQAGEISETLFAMETHAIMGEQRMTNPNHLKQIQESQKAKLERLNENGLSNLQFTAIMTENPGDEAVGIDRTLLSLKTMHHLNGSVEALNDHIDNALNSFSKTRSPLGVVRQPS